MNNTITWLLVADASKARLFSLHKAKLFQDAKAGYLNEVSSFSHEESRKKEAELTTDKMGEFGSSTFGETTSAKEHEAEVFAQQLIEALEEGRTDNAYRDIVLVAPPSFMGLLNKSMPDNIKKLISQTIEKDYTQQDKNALVSSLISYL